MCLVSCNDLLEEKPKSLVVENFYKTPEEVETATNAIYNQLRITTQMSVYEATLECLSDFIYGRGSWAQISEYTTLNDANITRVSTIWESFYVGIRCANLVIQNSSEENPQIAVFIAEAKFLRAFIYFQLVRNWGGVPIRTENNMSDKDVSRSSIDEVYDFILNDLIYAEKILPEEREQIGRPTKWATKALLADVYLQQKRYSEARLKAEEIIGSGKFSLVSISSKIDLQEKVYGPTVITSSEEIFYLKYSNIAAGQGNYMLWILNHQATGGFPFGGAYAIYGDKTNPIYQNWDDKDLRKQLWESVDFGLGSNTLVSTKFIDKNAISQNGGANDDPIYGYPDVLFLYAEALTMERGYVSAEAIDAINKIRRRAYGYDPIVQSDVDYNITDFSSVDDFIDVLLKERGYEFQVEGKRWLELKRMGKAKEIIKRTKGLDVSDDCLLWPIPISEMNYNASLDPVKDQNPGY